MRPQTRGPLPSDERVADYAARFPANTIVGAWAREQWAERTLQAHDFHPTCQDAEGCAQPSTWRGDGRCPHCGAGLLATGIAIFMCDHHHDTVIVALEWAERVGARFNHLSAAQVIDALEWTRL